MDLQEYLKAAPPTVAREEFGSGDLRFTVEFAFKRKTELEAMWKRVTKNVRMKNGQTRDEVDWDRLRGYLRDEVLRGWNGLTFGMFVRMCNLTVPNGALADYADKPLEFEAIKDGRPTRENVTTALLELRGKVVNTDGEETMQTFEGWLLGRLADIADTHARVEGLAKND